MVRRLTSDTLADALLPAPGHDRSTPASIVHLGMGAFARAHLGTYADDLLREGWPANIAGVSLRSPDAQAQLAPQDCLYTVTERGPGAAPEPRIIGAVTSVGTGADAAVAAMAGSGVRLVTATVTEKGYEVPDHDLSQPDRAGSAPGVIARALAARRRSGEAPPIFASLDNLAANGTILRRAVGSVAERLDAGLADWIEHHVAFPSSVVDRMAPATTEHDRAEVAARLGLADHAAVTAEAHRSWVIERADGLPPLDRVGVEVVDDVSAHQRRKLWLLNGPHSALAYAGLVARAPTIAQAAADPRVARFVRALVDDVLVVAALPAELTPGPYATDALRRFANPFLDHRCVQVGADGSRKLAQRLLPVAATRSAAALSNTRIATVVALWLAAVSGVPAGQQPLPRVDDPMAGELRSARPDRRAQTALAGCADVAFVAEVAAVLARLPNEGAGVLEVRS